MSPGLIDTVLAAGALALFGVAYAVVVVSSLPARIRPQAASPDLGGEPPAVVNLLANRWRLTEDAAESTLLDLAACGHLELRQPGADPQQTTIHLRQRDEGGTLTAHERRVLDRVTTLAVDGVVPVSALTFRDKRRARRWNRRLREEVVADARSRGVSRRRASPAALTALLSVAAVSAFGVGLAVLRVAVRDDDTGVAASFWSGAVVFGLLAWWRCARSASATPRPDVRRRPGGSACATGCAATKSSPTCHRRRWPYGTGTCRTEPRSG